MLRRSQRTSTKRRADESAQAHQTTPSDNKKNKTSEKASGKKVPRTFENLQKAPVKMSTANHILEPVQDEGKNSTNQDPPAGQDERKSRPLILFAHGAGAGSNSDFMQEWKAKLKEATNAVEVVTFDYPFMAGGKRGPPQKAEHLVKFHAQHMEAAMAAHTGHPLILCGKSLGSRVSGLLAGLDDCPAKAVVCLTYPLKGANGSIRHQILLDLKRPVICIQGSKDSMGPLDMLAEVRQKMTVRNELHVVEGGDHGLKVAAKRLKELGTTQESLINEAVTAVATFIASVLDEH